MKVDKINSCIVGRPSKVQIAKDDKWEEVWVIDVRKQIPSADVVQSYLQSSPFKYVSIEILFEQPDGVYIFGMDYNDHLLIKKPSDFLVTVIGVTTAYTDFPSFIKELNNRLIGKPYLFIDEPDAIRIGVINHWFSVGIWVAWKKGWSKTIRRDELQKKINSNPKLYKTTLNYQGMSFVFNLKGNSPGLCYWMKSPCSTKEGEYWVLSEQKISRYLKDWMDIAVI